MIKIKEAIVVEGKYDKIKLSEIFDTIIIKTDGFHIYKDKKTVDLLRKLAKTDGLIVLTDSDNAGLMIRNHLKNVLSGENVKHTFVPKVYGKEKRKVLPSKSGILGVEGIENDDILNAVLKVCTVLDENYIRNEKKEDFTRLSLFKMELYGKDKSSLYRKKLLNILNLPENMSVTMLLDVLNSLYSKNEIYEIVEKIKKEN